MSKTRRLQIRNRRRTSREAKAGPIRYLTVGQTARILGISPSTLRKWENVGLVTPTRSAGRFRLYTPETLQLLKRIKYLHDVKRLNVPGIKQALGDSLRGKRRRELSAQGRPKPDLGTKLRRLRTRCRLSVTDAAHRAGISVGFLSAVELASANASVATLQRLAAAYGTTVLELYDLKPQLSRVVRGDKRQALETKSGVRMELLSTGTKMLESMLMRVKPGAGSDGAYTHQGEDFIYILQGTLEIWLDEVECHTLVKGDSLWFESDRGHRWFNPGKEETAMIWVNTPPTF
jgi:DNA-binding transcriptional MerR regulator